MNRRKSYACLLTAAMVMAAVGSAFAQEFRATVRGEIVDANQGALPGATVTLRNTDTNEVGRATTNASGAYTVPFLRPGRYEMTVEVPGFGSTSAPEWCSRSTRPRPSTSSWRLAA